MLAEVCSLRRLAVVVDDNASQKLSISGSLESDYVT